MVTTSMAISCMWAWMIPHFYIEFSEYRIALERVNNSVLSAVSFGVRPITNERSDANKATVEGVCAAIVIIVVFYIGSFIGVGILTNPNINIDTDIDYNDNNDDDHDNELTKADAIIIGIGRMLSACLLAYFSIELPRWLGVTYSSQKHVEYYKQALITVTVIDPVRNEDVDADVEEIDVEVDEVPSTSTSMSAIATATTTTTDEEEATSATTITGPITGPLTVPVLPSNKNKNKIKNSKNNKNYKKKTIIGLKELTFRVCWSFLGHFFIMYPFLIMYFCNVKVGTIINSTFIGITFGFAIVYFVWFSHTKLNYKQRTYLAILLSLIIVLSSAAAFSAGCWYVKEVWYGYEEYTNEYTVSTFLVWTCILCFAHYVYYKLTQRKLVETAVKMGVTTATTTNNGADGDGDGDGGYNDRRNRNVRRNYNYSGSNADADSITYTIGGRRRIYVCGGSDSGDRGHQQTIKRDEVQKVKGEWRYGQSHIFQPPKSINCVANELGGVVSPRIKNRYAKFKQQRQQQHRRRGRGQRQRGLLRRNSGGAGQQQQQQQQEGIISLEDINDTNDENLVLSPTVLDLVNSQAMSSSSLPTLYPLNSSNDNDDDNDNAVFNGGTTTARMINSSSSRSRINTDATFRTASTTGSHSDAGVDVDVDDTGIDIDFDRIDTCVISSSLGDDSEADEDNEANASANANANAATNTATNTTTESRHNRLLVDMVAGMGIPSPPSLSQAQEHSATTIGANNGTLVDAIMDLDDSDREPYDNNSDEDDDDDDNLSVPSDVIHREEKENPTLWYMMKANSCCRRRRFYNAPPRKGCDLFINIFKWTIYAAAAWMHVGFTIICIGATLQRNTVRDALDNTFELLYPSNYETGPMCAWNNTNSSSTNAYNAYADILTFDSLEDVYESDYSVIHCGECGDCSNWNDLSLQWTTRTHLAELAKDCGKETLFGGSFEDVQDCNENKIGFTEECSMCWTTDEICAKDNCFFIFLQSVFTNQVNNYNVGHDDITTATCDEALCGPEFVPCSGATRRRMNIESDIPRPASQQCNVVKEDWSVVFNHLE